MILSVGITLVQCKHSTRIASSLHSQGVNPSARPSIICECVHRGADFYLPQCPGSDVQRKSTLPKLLPSLMPCLQRRGQIVLLDNGKLLKLPKEMGEKGGVNARKSCLNATERSAWGKKGVLWAESTQKCSNVEGARYPTSTSPYKTPQKDSLTSQVNKDNRTEIPW